VHARVLLVASLIALAPSALAQSIKIGGLHLDFADESMRPRTAEQRQFVSAYREAVATGRPDAIRALVHPSSLACSASDTGREYLSEIHPRDAKRVIPADARAIVVPMTRDLPMPSIIADMAALPVRATEVFALDYKFEERDNNGVLLKSSGGTVMRTLASHEGRLTIVDYCLTEKGETAWRQKRKKPAATIAPAESGK